MDAAGITLRVRSCKIGSVGVHARRMGLDASKVQNVPIKKRMRSDACAPKIIMRGHRAYKTAWPDAEGEPM